MKTHKDISTHKNIGQTKSIGTAVRIDGKTVQLPPYGSILRQCSHRCCKAGHHTTTSPQLDDTSQFFKNLTQHVFNSRTHTQQVERYSAYYRQPDPAASLAEYGIHDLKFNPGDRSGRQLVETNALFFTVRQAVETTQPGKPVSEEMQNIPPATDHAADFFIDQPYRQLMSQFEVEAKNVSGETKFVRLETVSCSPNSCYEVVVPGHGVVHCSWETSPNDGQFYDALLQHGQTITFQLLVFSYPKGGQPKNSQKKAAAAASSLDDEIETTNIAFGYLVGNSATDEACQPATVCLSIERPSQQPYLPKSFKPKQFAKKACLFTQDRVCIVGTQSRQLASPLYKLGHRIHLPGNSVLRPCKKSVELETLAMEQQRPDWTAVEEFNDGYFNVQTHLAQLTPENCVDKAKMQADLEEVYDHLQMEPIGHSFEVRFAVGEFTDHGAAEATGGPPPRTKCTVVEIDADALKDRDVREGQPFNLILDCELLNRDTNGGSFTLYKVVPFEIENGKVFGNISDAFAKRADQHCVKSFFCRYVKAHDRKQALMEKMLLHEPGDGSDWPRADSYVLPPTAKNRACGVKSEHQQPPETIEANHFRILQHLMQTREIDTDFTGDVTDAALQMLRIFSNALAGIPNNEKLVLISPPLRRLPEDHQRRIFMAGLACHGLQLATLIEGPPGTSKTMHAEEIIVLMLLAHMCAPEHLATIQPRVIFALASTNTAVQNLVDKLERTYGCLFGDKSVLATIYKRPLEYMRIFAIGKQRDGTAAATNNSNWVRSAEEGEEEGRGFIASCYPQGNRPPFQYEDGRKSHLELMTAGTFLVTYGAHVAAAQRMKKSPLMPMLLLYDEFSRSTLSEALAILGIFDRTPTVLLGGEDQLPPYQAAQLNQCGQLEAIAKELERRNEAVEKPVFPSEETCMAAMCRNMRLCPEQRLTLLDSYRVPEDLMQRLVLSACDKRFHGIRNHKTVTLANEELDAAARTKMFEDWPGLEKVTTAFFNVKSSGKAMLLENGTRVNFAEAEMVRRLALRLEVYGFNLAEDVTILAPYNGQVAHLRQMSWPTRSIPNIQTIDNVQGQDKRIVIVSLVRVAEAAASVQPLSADESAEVSAIGRLRFKFPERESKSDSIGFLHDPRRLFVGFSRTCCKLFIISNREVRSKIPIVRDFTAADSVELKAPLQLRE